MMITEIIAEVMPVCQSDVGKPDGLQDIIDDPAQRVHHHLPGHAGDDRAHPERQDENRPVDPHAPLDAVEQKPDRQAEADRPAYGSDRVDDRVLHPQPEEPRGENLLVIFQARRTGGLSGLCSRSED